MLHAVIKILIWKTSHLMSLLPLALNFVLPYCGLVLPYGLGILVSCGLGNGFGPVRHQALILINAVLSLIELVVTNCCNIWIKIQQFAYS